MTIIRIITMCVLLSNLADAVPSPVVTDIPVSRVTALPPVPDPVGFAGAFAGVHRACLVAAGGANFPDGKMPWDGGKKVWHDRIFLLDLASPGAAWRASGTLPAPRGYGASLSVPEGILMIGGGDATSNTAEVLLLSMAADKQSVRQSRLPPLPVPLAQQAAAAVGRRVHLAGGIERPDSTTAGSRHLMLDLDHLDLGWQVLPEFPGPARILATAAAVDGGYFVAGGCSLHADADGKPTRTYLRDAWKFVAGAWARLPDLPRAAVAAASPAPVSGHSWYIVSGDDGTQSGLASPAEHPGFPRDILRFDTRKSTWSMDGTLPVPAPVTLPAVPWKSGSIFFNGEVRPGVRTPVVFVFHPDPAAEP